jgi:O-antigen biosynthesis protein
LQGHLDVVTSRSIEGWARCAAHPDAPVCLDIFAGEQLIGQVLANRYREDLERAGIGRGRHGFLFALPQAFDVATLCVRRSFDGAALAPAPRQRILRRINA